MRGRKRPLTERAAAVGLATVVGVAEASRQTGIPRQTVQDWFESPEFGELRQRTKDQVADEWWAGVQRGMRAVIREFDGDAPLRDKAVAVGVMFDKLALMRGEATSRTESRSLIDDLDDHETEIFGEVVRAELTRRADELAAEVAVESPPQT